MTMLTRCTECGRLGQHTAQRCTMLTPGGLLIPADAIEVGGWIAENGCDADLRTFTGYTTAAELADGSSIDVAVRGEQFADGTVRRSIELDGVHGLTETEARSLAAALIATADRLASLG